MRRTTRPLVLISAFLALYPLASYAPIAGSCVAPLKFPDAATGDPNDVVAPASGAQINLTGGTANGGLNVVPPNSINMLNAAGDAVSANSFTGSPGVGNNCCNLNSSGALTVYIGGQRRTIQASDDPGDYSGTITVQVKDRSANQTINVNCTANLHVQRTITISKTRDLDFGSSAPNSAAEVCAAGAACSGAFAVTGEPNTLVNVSLPAGSITMTTGANTNANFRITVGSFTRSPTPATLSAAGTLTLYVGATMAATTAAQVAGAYTGSFPVTVAYP